MTPMPDILNALRTGGSLSEVQSESAFAEILSGRVGEEVLAEFLTLIAQRGPTVDELVGGARVMRRHVTPVDAPASGALIDTCGTGGAPKLFNVSTAGAIVTAAAAPGRVLVAKHGSLSRTGRGSAEVLKAIGVNVSASPAVQTRCLREIGLCFSFAVHHHPAMMHAAAVRKRLGFPTIFNLLGPLTNPAGARRQLMGTYSREVAAKLAATLHRLGVERAMVITSADGLDELTTTSLNHTWTIDGDGLSEASFDAIGAGFARARLEELQITTLEDAAATLQAVVKGGTGPLHDLVTLNAAGSLFVAGVAANIPDGVHMARRAVESGDAERALNALVRLTNE